jgi:exopolysaccharide biosynthesis protein
VVTINLADSRVSVRVSGGGQHPDGNVPWTTTLLPVSEIAAREGFDIAVNGDFFNAQATRDIEGRDIGYVRGKLASPVGMAMTDGRLWHSAEKAEPYLAISTNHTAHFYRGESGDSVAPGVFQILAGGQIIEEDGKAIEYTSAFATNRHPRTVVGLDRTGTKLTLVTVDGRQSNLSIGMTLHELSQQMILLGCTSALNLDGGGSTTLVYRDPATHAQKVVNSPSDSRERSVADALGIMVQAPMPPPD